MKFDFTYIYLIVTSLFIIGTFGALHEITHYTIFKYGCSSEANVTFGYSCNDKILCGPATFIDDASSCSDWVNLAQAQNELIGYNIMPAIVIIILILNFMFVVLVELTYRRKEVKVVWRK